MTAKQKYCILKLVSLYTGSKKINYKNNDRIFTVNDLIDKSENQHHSQWSLAIGELIIKYYEQGLGLIAFKMIKISALKVTLLLSQSK